MYLFNKYGQPLLKKYGSAAELKVSPYEKIQIYLFIYLLMFTRLIVIERTIWKITATTRKIIKKKISILKINRNYLIIS